MPTQANANFTPAKKNFMLDAWAAQTISIRFWDDTASPENVGSVALSFGSANNGQIATDTQPSVTVAAGKEVTRAEIIVGTVVQESFNFAPMEFPYGGDIIVEEFISVISNPS